MSAGQYIGFRGRWRVLSKNDNILIYTYIEMLQDLNPSTYSSLVIFMYWAWKSHFQCTTNREVAKASPRFCNELHLSHVIFVKVVPGTTFTSWSKYHFVVIGMAEQQCAKLPTVATRNNKDATSCTSYFCLFAPHGCCSSRTSPSWWIAHLPQR